MHSQDQHKREDSIQRQAVPKPRVGLPADPPWTIVFMAIAAMVLGFFASAENLLAIGLLRSTLGGDDPMVRRTALVEIELFRLGCLIMALIPLFWGRLARSSAANRIVGRVPREHGWVHSRDALFNLSLFVSLVCVLIAYAHGAFGGRVFTPDQLFEIGREDGVVEYATAFFFLLCSVASAILAYRDRAWRARAGMLGLFAFLFFLMCGEEISWGQRLFEVETLDVFAKYNRQGENNLHNLFGYIADHVFFLGVLAYGVLFPLLARRVPFFRRLFDYVGLPIASLGLAVGFLAASCLPKLGGFLSPADGPIILDLNLAAELREVLSSICFFLLLIEVWRKAPEDRNAAATVSA